MARIYPVLNDSQLAALPSAAEAQVYRRLRAALSDAFIVIHGKCFIAQRRDGGRRDGEADFIVFSASHGLLTIEVKGGGISYDPSRGWQSLDRSGKAHDIKDPFAQAKAQKYAVRDQLQCHRAWASLRRRIPTGHAVLLPDVSSLHSLNLPEGPREIVGGKDALSAIDQWIEAVFRYWQGRDDVPLGLDGLAIVEDILCKPITVRPMLRDVLNADDALRIKLTQGQASVLRTLGRHKRAAIVGAAGTGKTILAIEKARQLAECGGRVLLVCFNKPLGATLALQFPNNETVHACTFHQFCQYCCRVCVTSGMPDPIIRAKAEVPDGDYFDLQLPLAAYYALEQMGGALRYEAIVVDEGQDFGEEYWLPIEMALRSSASSWLYVFYDENQRLYTRVSSFPIPAHETYALTKNCRNAEPIHNLAYQYYAGEATESSGINGIEPVTVSCGGIGDQGRQIARQVVRLIHDEQIAPERIAVLVAGHAKEAYYDTLFKETLPQGASWSREEHFAKNSVLMDTVKRFKGLERDVIFLWLDEIAIADVSLMYVGLSRAKSVLYLIGSDACLRKLGGRRP